MVLDTGNTESACVVRGTCDFDITIFPAQEELLVDAQHPVPSPTRWIQAQPSGLMSTSRRRKAIATASALECAPSLASTLLTWLRTVWPLM